MYICSLAFFGIEVLSSKYGIDLSAGALVDL